MKLPALAEVWYLVNIDSVDYCGILFHNFCSGFCKCQCGVFRTHMPVADGQLRPSLETAVQECQAPHHQLLRVQTAFSHGFQCLWIFMCQISNSKIGKKCLYIYPSKASVISSSILFHRVIPRWGVVFACLFLNYNIVFHFLSVSWFLTPKCFFLWEGKDKSGLKTTGSQPQSGSWKLFSRQPWGVLYWSRLELPQLGFSSNSWTGWIKKFQSA